MNHRGRAAFLAGCTGRPGADQPAFAGAVLKDGEEWASGAFTAETGSSMAAASSVYRGLESSLETREASKAEAIRLNTIE